MASNFPGALDNIANDKSDNTKAAEDHAPHHNKLADAINAVQVALGVNLGNVAAAGAPASAAAAAVTAHESAVDPHSQYTTASEAAAAAPVQSVAGRTGAVTLAKTDVGLGNVDNTSDASKPVSTAMQTALNGKANTVHTHVKSDITDFSDADYATAAQGALAATAVQPAAIADFETTTQLNARDTANRNRQNHTGTQAASTISDFTSAAAGAAPVQSVAGRTGTVTLAKADVGLGNVDNTSDAAKPISTAMQTALNGKANTAHTHVKADITDFSDADYATAAQGALAATAVQPAAIANFETTTQLNARDTANRDRANHTGTQAASTISDFDAAADSRISSSNKVSSDITGITGADQITNMVSLTQAEYDAIGTKSATTFYVIAG